MGEHVLRIVNDSDVRSSNTAGAADMPGSMAMTKPGRGSGSNDRSGIEVRPIKAVENTAAFFHPMSRTETPRQGAAM